MAIESNKKELSFGINAFQKPQEYKGKDAWARLMCNLLFMRKGTYPTLPNMGIGIQDYEYEFLEDAIDQLAGEIPAQQKQYLPEVPLSSVQVTSQEVNGRQVLVVGIQFDDDGATDSLVVAAEVTNRLIDWEIVW